MRRKPIVKCISHLFDLEDITRDNFWCLDFLQLAITKDGSLERKCLFQFFDNRTSLILLEKTDKCIEEKQCTDDTEINPVLKTSSQNRSSL
jgi:hypothetical protein